LAVRFFARRNRRKINQLEKGLYESKEKELENPLEKRLDREG